MFGSCITHSLIIIKLKNKIKLTHKMHIPINMTAQRIANNTNPILRAYITHCTPYISSALGNIMFEPLEIYAPCQTELFATNKYKYQFGRERK